MCIKQGTLQAYLDGELAGREADRVAAHLAECPRCRARAERLEADRRLVAAALDRHLRYAGLQRDDLLAAWSGLQEKGPAGTIWEGVREKMGRFKMAAVAAVTVCVLAVPFVFAPVRALAMEFLDVFRVERVRVVDISAEELKEIERALTGQGTVDIEDFGRITAAGQPEYRAGITVEEAREAIGPGFKVPVPAGAGEPAWGLMTGCALTIVPDVKAINGLIARFGGSTFLPDTLDGKEFTLRQHPVATAEFTRPDGRKMVIAQGRSPELAVPHGTDVLALRDALLGLPFLPENVHRQLQGVSNWQNTVLVPNVEGEASPVKVNGAEGAFIDGHGPNNALIWADDGLVYLVHGENLTLDEALAAAASLR